MIKRILLDMDGVIVDFANPILKKLNTLIQDKKNYDSLEPSIFKRVSKVIEDIGEREVVYDDIVPHAGSKKIQDLMYRILQGDIDFWTHLPWLNGGKFLLDKLQKRKEELYILTSPMDNASIMGKSIWIKENTNIPLSNVIFERNKEKYANPESLLIDDTKENIDKFKTLGGKTIWFKGNWIKEKKSKPILSFPTTH